MRELTPSLEKTLTRCVRTVLAEIPRAPAICLLVMPPVSAASTRASPSVSA